MMFNLSQSSKSKSKLVEINSLRDGIVLIGSKRGVGWTGLGWVGSFELCSTPLVFLFLFFCHFLEMMDNH